MNMAIENTEVPRGLRKATIETATDWNDGAQLFGLDWVRDNIMAAIERKQTPAMWMERNGRIKTTDGRIMTQAQADELGLDAAVASTEVLSNVKVKARADMTDKKPKYEPRAYQQGDGVPDGFVVNDNGVWFTGGDATVKVCARLDVVALTRNDKSEAWGRLLQWNDADGKAHTWAMPIETVHGVAAELLRLISSQGLDVSPKSGGKLAEYIVSCKPAARATNINKTGWYNDVFVLPHQTIGQSNDTAIYQSTDGAANPYNTAGTLEQWTDSVAALCVGNSRCVMAVSMAFAGALLPLAGIEGGGVHVVGSSSTGKSTISKLAASVYGDSRFMRQWRATDNGLEGIASLHNHGILILDELSQAPAKSVGDAIYMLANGAGKIRAGRSGGSKLGKGWELLYLSNGEIGLAQHMGAAGKATHAGQDTRFAEVKADAGAGFGIFEQLHGFEGGAALSEAIKTNAAKCYGVAGVAFIEQCTVHNQALRAHLNDEITAFVTDAVGSDSEGQVQRVAQRFGLIGVAGELATLWGITEWQQGEALSAAKVCLHNWLDGRASGGANSEKSNMLEAVATFIMKHADSRFTNLDEARDEKIINRAGWKSKNQGGDLMAYLIIPDVFRKEVCAGFDYQSVLKVLEGGGHIKTSISKGKKRYSINQKMDGSQIGIYYIKGSVLNPESEGENSNEPNHAKPDIEYTKNECQPCQPCQPKLKPAFLGALSVGTTMGERLALNKAVPTDIKTSANHSTHVNTELAVSVGTVGTVGTQKTQSHNQNEWLENDTLGGGEWVL
jgi:putative DNA primase/helicase